MTYKSILDVQKGFMRQDIRWWTDFLYHFTDVHNASRILYDGWIYSRDMATKLNVMINDNASKAVIDSTYIENKCFGRLYFRPLTPTQYHNEGYKPKCVRQNNINASCPVPIFLCLNANDTLKFSGVQFAERGIAGGRTNILCGEEAFSKLDFSKIYHCGPYSQSEQDIKSYRHSEVIRQDGFPVEPLLRCILCRTKAERETLLFLLKQYSARLYNTYKDKVMYIPELVSTCFYNNGIFVKRVEIKNKILEIEFNHPEQRNGAENNSNIGIECFVEISYRKSNGCVITIDNFIGQLDYTKISQCSVNLRSNIDYDRIRVKVGFDDAVMYENEIAVVDEWI